MNDSSATLKAYTEAWVKHANLKKHIMPEIGSKELDELMEFIGDGRALTTGPVRAVPSFHHSFLPSILPSRL